MAPAVAGRVQIEPQQLSPRPRSAQAAIAGSPSAPSVPCQRSPLPGRRRSSRVSLGEAGLTAGRDVRPNLLEVVGCARRSGASLPQQCPPGPKRPAWNWSGAGQILCLQACSIADQPERRFAQHGRGIHRRRVPEECRRGLCRRARCSTRIPSWPCGHAASTSPIAPGRHPQRRLPSCRN